MNFFFSRIHRFNLYFRHIDTDANSATVCENNFTFCKGHFFAKQFFVIFISICIFVVIFSRGKFSCWFYDFFNIGYTNEVKFMFVTCLNFVINISDYWGCCWLLITIILEQFATTNFKSKKNQCNNHNDFEKWYNNFFDF